MRKVVKTVLALIILIPITYYGYYYFSLKKANREFHAYWYEKEYFPDSFEGVVSELNSYDGYYVMSIKVKNENDRVFNVCQKSIMISVGDSISKQKESYDLYKYINNKRELLSLSFCDD